MATKHRKQNNKKQSLSSRTKVQENQSNSITTNHDNNASKYTKTQSKQSNSVTTDKQKARNQQHAAATSKIAGSNQNTGVNAGATLAAMPYGKLDAESRLGVKPTQATQRNSTDEFNKFLNWKGLNHVSQNPLDIRQQQTPKQNNSLIKDKGPLSVNTLLGASSDTIIQKALPTVKHKSYSKTKAYSGLDSFDVTTLTPDVEARFASEQKKYEEMQANIPLSQRVSSDFVEGKNTETWLIVDGDKLPSVENLTKGAYITVGRDRLNGVRRTDKAIIYDKATGRFYRYDEDDETSAELKNKMNEAYNDYDVKYALSNYALMKANEKIEDAQEKLNTLQASYEKNGITEVYAEDIEKAYAEYNSAIEEYNKLIEQSKQYLGNAAEKYEKANNAYKKYGVYGASEDYVKKVNEIYDGYSKDKSDTEIIRNAMVNSSDPYAINSLKDVIVAISNINDTNDAGAILGQSDINDTSYIKKGNEKKSFGKYDNELEVCKAYAASFLAPIEAYKKGLISAGDMTKGIIFGRLNDLGESLDFLGAGEIKALAIDATPYINAYLKAVKNNTDMYQYIDEEKARFKTKHHYADTWIERLEDYFGANGRSVQYDWETDNMGWNFVLEMLSDPSNIVSIGAKALGKSTLQSASAIALKDLPNIKPEQVYDLATTIAKSTMKNEDLDKTVARALAKSGVEFDQTTLTNLTKRINDELLTQKAYTISKTLKDVDKTYDAMNSIVFTSSLFGVNKLFKPLAKAAIEATKTLGKPIVKEFDNIINFVKGRTKDYFNDSFDGLKKGVTPDVAADEVAKAVDDFSTEFRIKNITDFDFNKVFTDINKENANNIFNMWVRDELSYLMKCETSEEMLEAFGKIQNVPDEYAEVFETKASEADLIDYVKQINQMIVPECVTKDNSALLAGFNKKYLKLFRFDVDKLRDTYETTRELSDKLLSDIDNFVSKPHSFNTEEERRAYVDFMYKDMIAIKQSISESNTKLSFSFDYSGLDRFINAYIDGKATPEMLAEAKANIEYNTVFSEKMYNAARYKVGEYASKPEIALNNDSVSLTQSGGITQFRDAMNRIFKNHDVELTNDVFDNLVKENIEDVEKTGTIYSFDISQAKQTELYINNDNLTEAASRLLNLEDSSQRAILDVSCDGIRELESYANQQQLIKDVVNSESIPAVLRNGVIDTLTGRHKKAIDSIISLYNLCNADDYERCIDKLTNFVKTKAERTLVQRSDSIMWVNHVNGKNVRFNTGNTQKNVELMMNSLNDTEFSFAKNKLAEDELANNIFYSSVTPENCSSPIAISMCGPDGKIHTFINDDVEPRISNVYAASKFGEDAELVLKELEELKANNPECVYNTDDFYVAIDNQLKEYRNLENVDKVTQIRHKNRFVGFNNSAAVANQNLDMTRMFMNNSLSVHAYEYVDIANYLRSSKGFEYFTDEAQLELRTYIDKVMHNVMLNDFQEIKTSIVADFDKHDLESLNVLLDRLQDTPYDSTELQDIVSQAIKGIEEVSDTVIDIRKNFSNGFFNEKSLVDALKTAGANISGEHLNVVKELYKACGKDAEQAVDAVRVFNDEMLSEWVKLDDIKLDTSVVDEHDVRLNLAKAKEVISSLNTIRNNISYEYLLYEFPVEDYNRLLQEVSEFVNDSVKPFINYAVKDDDLTKKYSVLEYCYKVANKKFKEVKSNIQSVIEADVRRNLSKNDLYDLANKTNKELLPYMINEAKERNRLAYLILTDGASYDAKNYIDTFSPLRTRLKENDSKLNYINENLKRIENISKSFDRLEIQLAVQNKLLDENNMRTADSLITVQNFEPIRKNFKVLEDAIQDALDEYKAESRELCEQYNEVIKKGIDPETASFKLSEKLMKAEKLDKVEKTIRTYNVLHNEDLIDTMLNIPKESLTKYVVGNCYNCMLIDLKSKAVVSRLPVIREFIQKAKDAGLTVSNKNEMLTIYKDVSTMNIEDMSRLIDSVKAENPITFEDIFVTDSNIDNTIAKAINKAGHNLSAYLDDSFRLSNGTIMTTDAFENFENLIPAEARIPADVFQKHGMFDCQFITGIMSDVDSELNRSINAFGSADYVGNLYSATLFAKNKMEYVNDKFNVFTNGLNNIDKFADEDISYKEFKAALENNGMVVCYKDVATKNGVTYPVPRTFDINSEKAFQKAKDEHMCILRNDVFLSLAEESKSQAANLCDKNVIKKVLHNIQQDFVTGWLFTKVGTWFKNKLASNASAIIQTQDLDFIKVRMNINNVLAEYHNVETHLFDVLHTRYISESMLTDDVLNEVFSNMNYKYITPEDFKTIFASSMHSAGGVSSTLATVANNETKYIKERMLLAGATVKDCQTIIPQIVKTREKYGLDKLNATQKLLLKEEYKKIIKDNISIPDFTDDLAEICMSYVPTDKSLLKRTIEKTVVLDKWLEFNSGKFEEVEEQTRTSLLIYYTKYKNLTVSQALDKIIESQFDYTRMPKFLNAIVPFQSYKIYNMLFWLELGTKNFNSLNPMLKFYTVNNKYDDEDITEWSRTAYWSNYIESGKFAEDYTAYEDMSYAEVIQQSLNSTVNDYDGTNFYGSTNIGNIQIGEHTILKTGNALYDAFSQLISIMSIPFSLNTAQDFIRNNIFSPLNTLYDLIKFQHDNKDIYKTDNKEYANRFKAFLDSNTSEIIDLLPFYGILSNAVLQMARNSKTLDIAIDMIFPELEEGITNGENRSALDILTALLPSIFAIKKDDFYNKPIGYDWYNQSEEYKDTHRFVIGISTSNIGSKNPFTYVDTYGRLLKLGYTKEEAKEMMQNGWHLTETNQFRKYGNDLPNVLQYNQAVVDTTIGYLLQRGFTPDEAYEYMKDGLQWIDASGVTHSGTFALQAMENSEWGTYIDMLPDYIKYDWENQYSPQYNYYKKLGFKHDEILMHMLFDKGYIDEDGNYRQLTDSEIITKEKEINDAFEEFYNDLPDYCKYEDGVYSRTINYIKETMHLTTEQARQYMLDNNSYLDVDGIFHNYSDSEIVELNKKQQKEFYDFYEKLPACIKYEKGAYSRILKFLKTIGISTEKAKEMMLDGYYVSKDGKVSNVRNKAYTGKNYKGSYTKFKKGRKRWINYIRGYIRYKRRYRQRRSYSKRRYAKKSYVKKYYDPYYKHQRPQKVKKYKNQRIYSAGSYNTYSKQNVFLGRTKGQKALYKVNYNKLNSKSAMPASYRNIQYAYRHSLYKDMYAKYGTSRMLMRSGGYKAYSNASTTKLRRNAYKKQVMQNASARKRIMK